MYTGDGVGQRVEVVEPQTKGAARYVGESIAGGPWLGAPGRHRRQPDLLRRRARSTPAPTGRGSTSSPSPTSRCRHAKLDFASVDEAKLIATGLPYLHQVWSNPDWKLYARERIPARWCATPR